MSKNKTRSYDELNSSYSTLSEHEKTVLNILSFFMAPFAKTNVAIAMKNMHYRIEPNRQVYVNNITPFINTLINAGFIGERNGGVVIPCSKFRDELFNRLYQNQEEFLKYLTAVTLFIENLTSYTSTYYYISYQHLLQHLRLEIYLRNEEKCIKIMESAQHYFHYETPHSLFNSIFEDGIPKKLLLTLPESIFSMIVSEFCHRSLYEMTSSDVFDFMDEYIYKNSLESQQLQHLHFFYMLIRGRLCYVEQKLGNEDLSDFLDIRGVLAFLRGENDLAIDFFEKETARLKKSTGKRKIFLSGLQGSFYLLSLIRGGLPHQLKTAQELSDSALNKNQGGTITYILNIVAQYRIGISKYKKELAAQITRIKGYDELTLLFLTFATLTIEDCKSDAHLAELYALVESAETSGFSWISATALQLIKEVDKNYGNGYESIEKLIKEEKIAPLFCAANSEKDWEHSLKALKSIGMNKLPSTASSNSQSRLVWLLSGNNEFLNVQPIEQKLKKGIWSNGKNVALKRLQEAKSNTDFLSDQDRRVVATIKRDYGYYSNTTYEIDVNKAIIAMIGHPLVFNEKTGEQIAIAKGDFTLKVDRQKASIIITLHPPLEQLNAGNFFLWEGDSKVLIYTTNNDIIEIGGIIGKGVNIPADAEKEAAAAIGAISPFLTVHSDIAGIEGDIDAVEPDKYLYLILKPSGHGVSLESVIRPFGKDGPSFHPAVGGANIIATINNKKVQTTRDIKNEKRMMSELNSRCQSIEKYSVADFCWRIDEVEDALELLLDLKELSHDMSQQLVFEWPEGEKFKVKGCASWNKLSVSVSSSKDWFSIQGDVSVSDGDLINLQNLIELSEKEKGRFIQLADGEFIALTEEFRRRLNDLRRIVEKHGKENRFHPLAASIVEEALNGTASIKSDKLWKTMIEKFNFASKLEPKLPNTFQATLRDYQLEGFEWLSRLACWGVGGCLADDMGLGKTIQALALLADRASGGAALVLVPTSVCLNWELEANRFSPSLVPKLFGTGNRKEFIDSLQPFDLVICSYTLFQQEAELLTSYDWHTAVLDEAQAIKNMATKRSQAAMQLKAKFRLATTGTPVENRLDELWNLFRFLNPGFLGSHKSFTERFGNPIERDGDKNARTALKKLIRPFILRRTKSQVLQELPPRTDILQRVELSKEESALYEALRRKAVENLQSTDEKGEGERQIRILAEIMRLRRACCNPKLVLPESGIESAKLAAFRDIIDELRENGHRALVFSQFVDHLSLVRKNLDADNITYQYLDGSTPQKTRQESVAAFQRGEGELFLISLKAGGVGLNLTAADYVIHLDPWWNPAVEDQASDRAHRIGQLRPVTVYRLVAANTIEEKIVALHHQKRDLADSLLEGTDTAAKVSADDLMDLLVEI